MNDTAQRLPGILKQHPLLTHFGFGEVGAAFHRSQHP